MADSSSQSSVDPTCSTTHGRAEGDRQTKGEDGRNDASNGVFLPWGKSPDLRSFSHIKSLVNLMLKAFKHKNINIITSSSFELFPALIAEPTAAPKILPVVSPVAAPPHKRARQCARNAVDERHA